MYCVLYIHGKPNLYELRKNYYSLVYGNYIPKLSLEHVNFIIKYQMSDSESSYLDKEAYNNLLLELL